LKKQLIIVYTRISLLFCMALLLNACTNKVLNTSNYELAPQEINKAVLLQEINAFRKRGCRCGSVKFMPTHALKWNKNLETAALKHSQVMKKTNYFSHEEKRGPDVAERVKNTGYTDWSTVGENIAMGYATEKEVVAGWIKSTGHCSNIMNPDFDELGASTSGVYWTMVFAGRKN